MAVRFELTNSAQPGSSAVAEGDYRFVGLPPADRPPPRWLDPATQARIEGASALRLGPEPLIGPQRIVLSLGEHQQVLSTDGLAPFAAQAVQSATP
jgi:general secretion pathway protein H